MVPAISDYDILHRFKREMENQGFPTYWYYIIFGFIGLVFFIIILATCIQFCCCLGYGHYGGMYGGGYYGGRGYYGKDKQEEKKPNSESTSQV